MSDYIPTLYVGVITYSSKNTGQTNNYNDQNYQNDDQSIGLGGC